MEKKSTKVDFTPISRKKTFYIRTLFDVLLRLSQIRQLLLQTNYM